MRGVQRAHHDLLDFRAGETGRGIGQRTHREAAPVHLALVQVQLENLAARRCIRQVDEEDFVEAALAQQLRRQLLHRIRGRHQEHARLPLGHPGEEVAEDAARYAAVLFATAGGQAFLDLVHPQHAGRELLGRFERVAQVLLGLAVVLVVQRAEIQAHQRHAQAAGNGLRRQ